MFTPEVNDLSDLQSQDPEFFADWLRNGITGVVVFGEGRDAFPGAEPFLLWQDSLTEELQAIHDALPPRVQRAFEKGCAIAIARLDLAKVQDLRLGRELLLLAARVRAYEALGALAALAPDLTGPRDGMDLLDLAFDVAVDLATYGHRTGADAVGHLMRAPGRQPHHARAALLALSTIEPDKLADHLARLAEPLNVVYGPAYGDPEQERARRVGRRRLVRSVAERVPSDTVLAGSLNPWPRIPKNQPRQSTSVDEDWWFSTITDSTDPDMQQIFTDRIMRGLADSLMQGADVTPASWTEVTPDNAYEKAAVTLGSDGECDSLQQDHLENTTEDMASDAALLIEGGGEVSIQVSRFVSARQALMSECLGQRPPEELLYVAALAA